MQNSEFIHFKAAARSSEAFCFGTQRLTARSKSAQAQALQPQCLQWVSQPCYKAWRPPGYQAAPAGRPALLLPHCCRNPSCPRRADKCQAAWGVARVLGGHRTGLSEQSAHGERVEWREAQVQQLSGIMPHVRHSNL